MNIEKEDLNFLFHCLGIGVLKMPEILKWCDNLIANSDQPDRNLLDLSMAKNNELQRYFLLMGADEEISDYLFLTIISGGYFTKRLNLDQTLRNLFDHFCLEYKIDGITDEIYLIDDEWGWDKIRAKKRLKNLLQKYKDSFDDYYNRLIAAPSIKPI